jgi:hypothetical protein
MYCNCSSVNINEFSCICPEDWFHQYIIFGLLVIFILIFKFVAPFIEGCVDNFRENNRLHTILGDRP